MYFTVHTEIRLEIDQIPRGLSFSIANNDLLMNKLRSTHLYQYIQLYLTEDEYRDLMDTNKEMFQQIKKETMCYYITVYPDDPDGFPYTRIARIIGCIKDPKKQMKLSIEHFHSKDLFCLNLVVSHLYEVSIETSIHTYCPGNFDFKIFNNIPIVILSGFPGVTSISEGLENIKILELSMPDLESIHDISQGGNLKVFKLSYCSGLKHIQGVNDSQSDIMKIVLNPAVTGKRFTFQDSSISFSRLSLKEMFIYLSPEIPNEIDLVAFCHVRSLDIGCVTGLKFPKVSLLSDFVDLWNFDLSEWSTDGLELPFVRDLTLSRCSNMTTFPMMPKIERMMLINMASLESIPTFPTLKRLVIHLCASLRELKPQPKLFDLSVRYTMNLIDFSALDGQVFISVTCDTLVNAIPFRNAYSLSLDYSSNVTSIGGKDSVLLPSRRSIILRQTIPRDCLLSNLFRLELSEIDLFSVEIKNIAQLELNHCKNFFNTTNIQNITQSLTLRYCNDLVSLSNLQNIPRVNLDKLSNVKDISGLGHHDHLYIKDVPFLHDLIVAYAANERLNDQPAAGANFSSRIFSTIKTVTIVSTSSNDQKRTRLW